MTAAHDALVAHLLAAQRPHGRLHAEEREAEHVVHRRQADDLPGRRDAPRRRRRARGHPRRRHRHRGLTMGADAVAFGIAAIAATRGRTLRSFSVRKEVKDHGGGGRIAGALEPGDRVVITEDAVTRGRVDARGGRGDPRRGRRRAGAAPPGGRPRRHRRGDGRRRRACRSGRW